MLLFFDMPRSNVLDSTNLIVGWSETDFVRLYDNVPNSSFPKLPLDARRFSMSFYVVWSHIHTSQNLKHV
jgi:hypothetical protein